MTVTYCDVFDVKRALSSASFKSDTTPTNEDINKMINEAEDEIDRLTANSWRSTTVTNEFYDIPGRYIQHRHTGIPIYLHHRNVKTLTTGSGDKVEVWDGSNYDDWLTSKTEGRGDDYWIDETQGILYLRYFYPYYIKRALRMTYRYGETTVPGDIKKACMLMVASQILIMEDRAQVVMETGDPTRLNYFDRVDKWQKQIDRIILNRTEIRVL